MSLTSGTRLGSYEIVSLLGAGGMGEVYRARDTKLGREVAIKILPDAFAADADRLARFQREAQLLASLNHPAIAAIYGIEDSTPVKALVLELVEGETLAERIETERAQGRAVPIDEALAIAKQIADALEAAHEQGIIHRDLKPANVKLRPDGAVKVLDFGLAKLQTGDSAGTGGAGLSMSPTLTVHGTYAGVILGTAAYMSPEQARGKPVDRRADIWAFGCVLFEMITGKRAFEAGETVSDAIATILTREPDLSALPATTPAAIRTLVRRCLEKNPQKRLPHVGTARLEIEEALAGAPLDQAPPERSAPRSRNPLTIVAVGLGSAAMAALAAWALLRPLPASRTVVRLQVASRLPLVITSAVPDLALSPDGTHIAYAAGSSSQLFVRALGDNEPKGLVGVVNARAPFFSPDGAWIAYFQANALMKVSRAGGPVLTICNTCAAGNRGGSWGPDDTIVFAANGGSSLFRVSAAGGEPALLGGRRAGESVSYLWPEILPGGRAVLVTSGGGTDVERSQRSQVVLLDLQSGAQKILARGAGQAHYSATGHLVYAGDGTLLAVPFDLVTLETRGDPTPVLDHVVTKRTGAANFSLSRDGLLAYVSGAGAVPGQTLSWIDRQRREEPTGAPLREYAVPRISSDGQRVVVDARDLDIDIWMWGFERRALSRVTFDLAPDTYPVWTPDGRRIVFRSERGGQTGLFWQAADGSGDAERLSGSVYQQTPYAFSPDGQSLVYGELDRKTDYDLFVRSMADGSTKLLIRTPFAETNAEISPDGRWLAYQSNEAEQDQIYVRPFPAVDTGRWQVSTAGGTRPLWARSGRELFYLDLAGRLMTVPVTLTPTFSSGSPTVILETLFFPGVPGRYFDVSPDGRIDFWPDVRSRSSADQSHRAANEMWC